MNKDTRIEVISAGDLEVATTLGQLSDSACHAIDDMSVNEGLGDSLYLTEDGQLVTVEAVIEITPVTGHMMDLYEGAIERAGLEQCQHCFSWFYKDKGCPCQSDEPMKTYTFRGAVVDRTSSAEADVVAPNLFAAKAGLHNMSYEVMDEGRPESHDFLWDGCDPEVSDTVAGEE